MKRIASWTLLALVLGCGWAQAATLTVDAAGGGEYTNLAPAIAAALPGDLITVADGTYVQTVQLNVNKALTIQGASEAGVVIDCSAVGGYGFSVYASDVTMENLTILPPTPNYPIHASGTSNPPDGFDNLTLRHITVTGVHQRAGFDIHGYNTVVLSHLTSGDATGGNGLQITGCVDVSADNITTFNNAWGSIAIYCSNPTDYLNRGCSNVVFDGATLSVGEDAVFIQDEFGLVSSGVVVTGWGHHVRNSRFREPGTDSAGYTFLRDDLAHAAALALSLPYPEASTILDLATGQYAVVDGMGIQAAIDAATGGDVINVGAGTYSEVLLVDKHVDLVGAGSGSDPLANTVITAGSAMGPRLITLAASGASAGDPILLRDLRLEPDGVVGLEVHNGQVVAFLELDNVVVDGTNQTNDTESEIGLRVATDGTLTDVVMTDCAFDHLTYGWYFAKVVDLADPSTVSGLTVTNTSFSNNDAKGAYVEKLENAVFTNCVVHNNGIHTSFWNNAWNGGFDVNLKAGTYGNLTFSGCTFTDNGLNVMEGAGLLLKGRGTGTLDTSYAANPATLDNVLVEDCVFTGNERGLRFGEPNRDNTTPTNAVVTGCTLLDNVQTYAGSDGSAYGDLVNVTTAAVAAGFNWWGDIDATDQVGGTGPVGVSPWLGAAPGTSPMTWYVNPTGTIQAAVDAAAAGDGIVVAAGHYQEQVHVAKDDLTITGAGVGATFVDAPADMPLFFTTSADNFPVVFVEGATGTVLSGLTIDGLGNGALNYRFVGLGVRNADGVFSDLHVTRVRNEPLNGSQHGIGLYVSNGDEAARTVSFTDVAVDDTQKNGTVFDGAGLTVTALRLACTGNGPLGVGLPAQNGVQVSGGAVAELTDCTFADYDYTDPEWTACGLMVYGPSSVDVSGGAITACRTSIYLIDASGAIDGITVTNPVGDPMYAYASAAKAAGSAIVQPQGFDVTGAGSPEKAATVVTLTNSIFIGNDTVDSWGPTAWAEDAVDFTVQGCTIEHFDYGLCLYEDGGTVTGAAGGNFLRDNLTYGAWSNTVLPYDARGNDWGHISGPFHPVLNPTGQGNEVSDNILFEPWTGQAGLGITPATSGPLACGGNLDLTFQYTADDATPDMFLYNVVMRVPAQMFFNSITDELPFGSVNNNFFVTDNLDGTWTVTGSTVGSPTSPVAGPGTFDLFTVHFQTVAEGTGVVAIEDFALRDPTNAPIPAGASDATVLVDCTAPAAVTGITAAPGHNSVDVAWTHDGTDVDHYRVFAGLWHDGTGASAYPEYDDLAGDVIPARPAGYAAALASTEWDSLPAVAVTSQTQTWADHLERGVYYYEVFAVDAAGNASPAAAANDRATNYWLGDVYGDTAGDLVPNGLVNVRDINYMAPTFGTSVPLGDPDGIFDIGPTDDWSRLGVPLTDSRVDFEDLMVFSMNFGVVSAAKDQSPVSSRAVLAWVDYGEGRYGLRLVEGPSLKGLRVTASTAVTVVEAGALLDEQGEPTFLRNVGSQLDASVAVLGVDNPFAGAGDLMVVTAEQAIDLSDLVIDARATDNSKLEVSLEKASDSLTPRVFALHANYPNPFNPMTKISFSLPEAQPVRLVIYGVDGRRVATLVDEVRGPGLHEVLWNGQDDGGRQSASGVYFYRVDAGPYSEVRKMTLMK